MQKDALAEGLKQHALECLEKLQGYRAIEENFRRAAKAYTALTGEDIPLPEGTAVKGIGALRQGTSKGRPAKQIVLDYLRANPNGTTRSILEANEGEANIAALSAAVHELKKKGIIGAQSTEGNAIVYFLKNQDGKSAVVKNETNGATRASFNGKLKPGEAVRRLLTYLANHQDAKIGDIKADSAVTSPESSLDRMWKKKLVKRTGTRETGVVWNIAAPGRNLLAEDVTSAQM